MKWAQDIFRSIWTSFNSIFVRIVLVSCIVIVLGKILYTYAIGHDGLVKFRLISRPTEVNMDVSHTSLVKHLSKPGYDGCIFRIGGPFYTVFTVDTILLPQGKYDIAGHDFQPFADTFLIGAKFERLSNGPIRLWMYASASQYTNQSNWVNYPMDTLPSSIVKRSKLATSETTPYNAFVRFEKGSTLWLKFAKDMELFPRDAHSVSLSLVPRSEVWRQVFSDGDTTSARYQAISITQMTEDHQGALKTELVTRVSADTIVGYAYNAAYSVPAETHRGTFHFAGENLASHVALKVNHSYETLPPMVYSINTEVAAYQMQALSNVLDIELTDGFLTLGEQRMRLSSLDNLKIVGEMIVHLESSQMGPTIYAEGEAWSAEVNGVEVRKSRWETMTPDVRGSIVGAFAGSVLTLLLSAIIRMRK